MFRSIITMPKHKSRNPVFDLLLGLLALVFLGWFSLVLVANVVGLFERSKR